VAPCNLVQVYQRFEGPSCVHHQDRPEGATTHTTAIFENFQFLALMQTGFVPNLSLLISSEDQFLKYLPC
jgi:hypothetical protein